MAKHNVVLVLMAAVLACERSSPVSNTLELTDSAGIAIASNHFGGDAAPDFALPDTARVEIGVSDGPEELQLFRVRGGVRLSDGRIAILNAGSHQIRVYGPNGQHLVSVGRRGEGPGEFMSPMRLWRTVGDSVITWDTRTRRLTVIDSTGRFARTARLAEQAANPVLLNVLSDGTFIIQDERFDVSEQFQETHLELTHYGPDGSLIRSVGTYPLSRIGMLVAEQGLIGAPLFEPRTSTAGTSDGFWLGVARDYEATAYDPAGKPLRVVRWTGPDRSVSSDAVNAAHAARLAAAAEEDKPRIRRILETQPVAERFPAYQAIMAGADGTLRVLQYERPQHEGPSRWLIFDSDGRLTGRLSVPRGFLPLEWGADYVLGVTTDDLGVERVQLYSMSTR